MTVAPNGLAQITGIFAGSLLSVRAGSSAERHRGVPRGATASIGAFLRPGESARGLS
jgi:hypothetical protein